jgi:DNA modification methylase
MDIEQTLVRELRPYPGNARTHSKNQIRQLAKSIQNFGFNSPVLIDGNNQVIAGHARLEAAKLLGLHAVPAIRLSHLSETEKRAYVLADNKLALKAGWDREMLATEFQGLLELEVDIALTGFEMAEVDVILDEAAEARGEAAEDTKCADAAEDSTPVYSAESALTRVGDLWVLGHHRLLCGDARSQSAYEALLTGVPAQFAFTDPPYNVPIDGHVCGLGRIRHKNFAMGCGEMSPAQFTEFLESVFRCLALNTIDGSVHDICMDWRHVPEITAAGKKIYGELKNLCVWNKSNAGMGSFYRSKHELIFVFKNGTSPHINNFELGQHGRTRTNVWDYPGISSMRAGRLDELAMHPTVKPVALVADAIKDCSHRGGLVLDPFCGSGTILIAAERTGRKARAMEIDPHYVDVAVRRWQTYSGRNAVLESTGQTFEEVEEQRAALPTAA